MNISRHALCVLMTDSHHLPFAHAAYKLKNTKLVTKTTSAENTARGYVQDARLRAK